MNTLLWDAEWRQCSWATLDQPWDVIVVGGGIVGAGVLREAACAGLRVLLLERHDFAWGASSRSTKLVHGGLRYLAHGQVGVAHSLVTQRERLLREVPGLVTPLPFLVPLYQGQRSRRLAYQVALGVYDGLAGRVRRHRVSAGDLAMLAPPVHRDRLVGGLRYLDAQTDDARLVLRVLREAAAAGALALNATDVTGLVRRHGQVAGVTVHNQLTGQAGELFARVVVNATGAQADQLRSQVGGPARMRPLRGSHLLFPNWRFPLDVGVNVRSPDDGRHISVLPWEGATLVGTTDLDHDGDPAHEAAITSEEVTYLLGCLAGPFRSLDLTANDVVSTWSGVRPIVASGARQSRDERRQHVVWDEHGLLTAAGGKLTTYQLLARDVMRAATPYLLPRCSTRQDAPPTLTVDVEQRLAGRFGAEIRLLTASAQDCDWERDTVADTSTTWAELRWSARCEAITSLEDLLLRRTRLGLLLPTGGAQILDRVRHICQQELGWDSPRWDRERINYQRLVRDNYAVPPTATTVST